MDDRRVQTTQYRVKQVMVDRRSYTGVHSHTGTLKAPRGARDVCVCVCVCVCVGGGLYLNSPLDLSGRRGIEPRSWIKTTGDRTER
jgi:hypothetical protein